MKFVLKGPINYIPALAQIMAWYRSGDKPLFEPMMVRLSTHIYASLGLNELTALPVFCIQTWTVFPTVRHEGLLGLCYLNSLWPKNAIWCHSFGSLLVQVMIFCLKSSYYLLSRPDKGFLIVKMTLSNKLQWNINWNSSNFIKENTFENLWKMEALLFRIQRVIKLIDTIWQQRSGSKWDQKLLI